MFTLTWIMILTAGIMLLHQNALTEYTLPGGRGAHLQKGLPKHLVLHPIKQIKATSSAFIYLQYNLKFDLIGHRPKCMFKNCAMNIFYMH